MLKRAETEVSSSSSRLPAFLFSTLTSLPLLRSPFSPTLPTDALHSSQLSPNLNRSNVISCL